MKFTRPSDVHSLITQLGIKPQRRLGQNFLTDKNILDQILKAAELEPGEKVLEVGAGLGVLTEALLKKGHKVQAIEIDRTLFQHLTGYFADTPDLELVHADILKLNLDDLLAPGISSIVSNLPYATGSRFLMDLMFSSPLPRQLVITIQREVADRLTAQTDTKAYGLLSVCVQQHYEVRRCRTISPRCFYPVPAISSALIKMTLRHPPPAADWDQDAYRGLLKHAFSQRRKQVISILSSSKSFYPGDRTSLASLLESLGIPPNARPENLEPPQWIKLSEALRGR